MVAEQVLVLAVVLVVVQQVVQQQVAQQLELLQRSVWWLQVWRL